MNQMLKSQSVTMSSLELLDVINASRHEHGQGGLRRNDFHARVTDELEGEYYETFVVENHNGTKTTAYKLNHDQCLLVAMRESKAVRRSVLEKIKAIESGNALPSIPATMALCELAITVLRPSESGKVVMLQKAGKATGADTSFLPDYTEDSAPGHVGAMDTASATQLLREYGVKCAAAAFNERLRQIGLLEQRRRKSSGGKEKRFWCITNEGLAYGKNVVSPQSPRETQPHWYRARFVELVTLIGLECAA
ncbi:hypothetical protein ACIGG6_02525 [Vreelandella lionensis]|uniref:Rha family transcriptional regulator n=1 Tax=Vreelandella lionensis TaxID=1144478 RepID=A0ABW8BNV5_9GAMM